MRQCLEMMARRRLVSEAPGGNAGGPIGGRNLQARSLGACCGQGQGSSVLALEEIGCRDVPTLFVELNRLEQAFDIAVTHVFGGAFRITAPEMTEHVHAQLTHLRSLSGVAPGDRFRGGMGRRRCDRSGPRRLNDRAARCLGVLRLAPHGELPDAKRTRLFGVLLQPVGKLGVARAVLGRVHVALVQHPAHQHTVCQALDHAVGSSPVTFVLEREDVAVAGHVGIAEQLQTLLHSVGL